MLLDELNSQEIRGTIQFHDELCPLIWKDGDMRLEVRLRLLRAAIAFYQFIDVKGLKVSDIVMTGSSTAYNYTELSDIDLHLIVDYDSICSELADNFFTTKKTLWNDTYPIEIRGLTVELYVEDSKSSAISQGRYSVLRGEWITHAKKEKPSIDDRAIVAKTEQYAAEIENLLDAPNKDKVDAMLKRLKKLRQAGLSDSGEYSVENLTFKALRNLGLMQQLWDARITDLIDSLSLD